MEKDRQKSECGSESTGTISDLLIVLSSSFFLFPESYLVGVMSSISSLLMGRRAKAFLLLAAAIAIHEITVVFAFVSENAIIFRFCSLAAALLVGCIIIGRLRKAIATGLATAVVAIATVPAVAIMLGLGSVVSCVGVVYIYLLLFSWIFGLFFLVVNYEVRKRKVLKDNCIY